MLGKNMRPFLGRLMNKVTAKQIHIIRLNQHGKHCGLIMRISKMSELLTSDVGCSHSWPTFRAYAFRLEKKQNAFEEKSYA